MPQFDPTFYASQLFWLYITFGLLIVLLSTFAIPKIDGVLKERRFKIESNLDKAEALRSEAQGIMLNCESMAAESHVQAKQIIMENAALSIRKAEAAQKAMGEKLAQQVKAGEDSIRLAKQEAMGQVREIAEAVAMKAIDRLANIAPDKEAVSAAVTAAISDGSH